MKTRYKFIHFVKGESEGFSPYQWNCLANKNDRQLGTIGHDSLWAEAVFRPTTTKLILPAQTCRDIADFCEQLNKEVEG